MTQYRRNDVIVVSWADENTYMGTLDLVSHEFVHGIVRHTADLKYERESGALNESFADIFGVVVERYTEDQLGIANPDWDISEDTPATWVLRNLEFPMQHGVHYNPNIVPCGNAIEIGQPDTYEGDFWYFEEDRSTMDQCDNYGVHVNSGPQNKWFQLLADGGTHNGVNVVGIGVQNAADIAYYALTTSLGKHSQYINSRVATTNAAVDLFGACSIHHQSVSDAWDAVQVPGIAVDCFPQGDKYRPNVENSIFAYPNPSNGNFIIKSSQPMIGNITITSIHGKILNTFDANGEKELKLSLDLPSGFYILTLQDVSASKVLRIIIQ